MKRGCLLELLGTEARHGGRESSVPTLSLTLPALPLPPLSSPSSFPIAGLPHIQLSSTWRPNDPRPVLVPSLTLHTHTYRIQRLLCARASPSPLLNRHPGPAHARAHTHKHTQTPGVLAGSRPRGIRLSCPSQRAPADHNMFILRADFLSGGPGKRAGAFRPGIPEHDWSGICPIMLTRRLGYRDIPDHVVLYPRTSSGISPIMGISPIRDIPMISP